MYKKILFVLSLLMCFVFSQESYSQSSTSKHAQMKGYIDIDGRLKQGYILPVKMKNHFTHCYYRKSLNGDDIKYFPDKINGYGIDKENKWVSIRTKDFNNGESIFFLVLLKGRVEYYYSDTGKEKAVIIIEGSDTTIIKDSGKPRDVINELKTEFSGRIGTANAAEGLQFNYITIGRVSECLNDSRLYYIPRKHFNISAGVKNSKYLIPRDMTNTLENALVFSSISPFFGISYNIPLGSNTSFRPGLTFSQGEYIAAEYSRFKARSITVPLVIDYKIGKRPMLPLLIVGLSYNNFNVLKDEIWTGHVNSYQINRLGSDLAGIIIGAELRKQSGGRFNISGGLMGEAFFDMNNHSLPSLFGVSAYLSAGF